MKRKIQLTEHNLYNMVLKTLNILRESFGETRGGEVEVEVIEDNINQTLNVSESRIKKAIHDSVLNFINEDVQGRTAIIYHRSDWDGFNCGAIALMVYPNADLIGWTYGDPLPNVDGYDRVILLDLTLTINGDNSWMVKNGNKLTWIDHHAFVISDPTLQHIEGVRKDGIGACALAWEYFFGERDMPLHIRLCATQDVFRKDGAYAEWNDAWAYNLALSENFLSYKANPVEGIQVATKYINEPQVETEKRVEFGYTLEEERARYEEEFFKGAEFVERDGVRICKIYTDGTKSPAHLIRTNLDNHTADLFILFHISPKVIGSNLHKVELRVPERSNIDCSAIARQYGGGGHVKASGCSMTQEQFDAI